MRKIAVERMTEGTKDLVARIEDRRSRAVQESGDFKRRLCYLLLFQELHNRITAALSRIGKTFADLMALPEQAVTGLFDLVPTRSIL